MIAFGTAKQRENFFGEPVNVSTRDRLAAMVELRDSGPGRPMQTLDLGDGSPDVPAFTLPPETPGVRVWEPGLSPFPAPTSPATITENRTSQPDDPAGAHEAPSRPPRPRG